MAEDDNAKQMNADQEEAVSCRKNAVVSAGAGSGKTFVLAERYVQLLRTEGVKVEEILTLTFTRKAAAEMYERIYRRMLLERTRSKNIQREIVNFDKAQISTLDSFCSRIVRGAGGMFGIPPDFVTDEQEAFSTAKEFSLGYLLQHAHEPALEEFIRINGFERIWNDFLTPVAHGYLSLAKQKDFPGMRGTQHRRLLEKIDEHVREMEGIAARIHALNGSAGKSVENAQKALLNAGELRESYEAGDFRRFSDCCSGLKWNRPSSRSKNTDLVLLIDYTESFSSHREEAEKIAAALTHWKLFAGMFDMLTEFQEAFLREKRRSRALSFSDVQDVALEILRGSPAIRGFYKNQYRFIMIDEFQDNNRIQKDLLYLLAEKDGLFTEYPGPEDLDPGKLFFVGDEKQSIYRFRGADVSVFKGLCTEIADTGGIHLNLGINYRSTPSLIGFFNRIFKGVLENGGEPYEADFIPLKPRSEKERTESIVKIFYKPYEQELPEGYISGDEAEAYKIAEYIYNAVESNTLVITENGSKRPVRYEDIAVLMRSTGSQYKYEKAFRRLGVPYTTESVRTLFLEAPLNDIYHLLQLAVYPGDRSAYAGYLRSPLVNLGDAALFNLLLSDTAPFSMMPEEVSGIPGERKKYIYGKQCYDFVKDNADEIPLAELINHIWYRFGYRYFLLKDPAYSPYLEFYTYLYRLALAADRKGETLCRFLDFLRENLGKYERLEDLEILRESSTGVQILTIHKSKGLEFPVVFITNAGNTGRNSGLFRPFHISPEYGLTFSAPGEKGGKMSNYFFEAEKEEEKKKDRAELKRLLYVGCTRAQQHLFISGCHTRMNRNADTSLLNIALKALGWEPGSDPVADESLGEFLEVIENVEESRAIRFRNRIPPPDPQRLLDAYRKAGVKQFGLYRKEFPATDLKGPESEARGTVLPGLPSGLEYGDAGKQDVFGTLTHFIMEQMIHGTYYRPGIPPSCLAVFEDSRRETAVNDAEILCRRFFDHELGELMQTALSCETETSFVYRYETGGKEYFINGRMDLLIETPEEAVVVDFKTDREYIPGKYDMQMSVYCEAARELTGKRTRGFFYFMRSSESFEFTPAGPEQDFRSLFTAEQEAGRV